MKTRIALTTALAGLLPLAGFAQSPSPIEESPQPAVAPVPSSATAAPAAPAPAVPAAPAAPGAPATAPEPPRHRFFHDEMPKEPVTFLGVETSQVPRVVSEQLGLPRGFGVVIDYVVPNSAAAAAGLQQNDILRQLNDQMVIDSNQLGVLVRSFPDGASVNLTILRKGQEMKLTARLQKKQERSGRGATGYEWNFDDLDHLQGLNKLKDLHIPDMSAVNEAVERAKAEALRAGAQARAAARNLRVITSDDGTVKATHIDLGKAQIVFSDDKGELRLETVDGKKMLTAKDTSGKVLFQGPIDTAEEREKIPPEVRKRFENLEDEDLPAIPPNEELAPRPPNPGASARLHRGEMEEATLRTTGRSGWVRDTIRL